jgi:hypothetical protein
MVHLATTGPSGTSECHAAVVTAILADDGTVELTEFDGVGVTIHGGIEHHGASGDVYPCDEMPSTYRRETWHWAVAA